MFGNDVERWPGVHNFPRTSLLLYELDCIVVLEVAAGGAAGRTWLLSH